MKRIITTTLGIFIIICITLATVTSNFNVGNAMIYILGFVLILWYNVPKNKLTAALKALALAGYGIVFAMVGFILISSGVTKADGTEDAVIILGCGIHGDRLTRPLKYRLDTAVEYCNDNPDCVIVVTGGQGPQEDMTEADAMYFYLLGQGIAPSKIIKEPRATSTNENFKYSKLLLDKHFNVKSYKTVCVTNRFHAYRAEQLAKLNGLNCTTCSAPIGISAAAPSYMREVLAIFQLWIFKR